QQELDDLIADWSRTIPSAELMALLEREGIPAGPIYRAPEMLADPHFQAREAIVRVDDPNFGKLAMQNVAPRLSATPGRINHAGGALGQHNEEIYGKLLGMTPERMAELAAAGDI